MIFLDRRDAGGSWQRHYDPIGEGRYRCIGLPEAASPSLRGGSGADAPVGCDLLKEDGRTFQ